MLITDLNQLQALESWSTRKTKAVCVNVIQETHDVKTFQFRAEPQHLFHFKPGQFIGIQLEIDGEKHNRSYTIASSPTRPHLLDLTIKLDPAGSVSPWLHANISIGSELELRGPAGRFNCFDIQSEKVLLISAGSGITPMMSMARFWCDQAADKNIQFLNWARSTQDIIFRREIGLLDHQYHQFAAEVILTQPGLSENWLGRRGRINATTLSDMVPDLNERTVFCCGPDGFMAQVKSCLAELGFDMANYHDETFDPGGKKKAKVAALKAEAEKTVTAETKGPFQLTFKKTGKIVDVEANEILLERIEAEGIAIESACRAGNCGACQVKKLTGETKSANEIGLHEDRRDEGYILTCTTHIESDVELDI
ncbi:hybrid-cluster NAD(P)-dependent oxidoreductase [Aliikangiella marina]|uniref:Hybrid-cluster NAD(P)-dependent oxidoreductase n=1 Tax=Aliikangiella marina TaxID=1712262 RepID=A0A545T1J6_9GAMM|nr:hybrid-cluster NAD(P)-dependent oxidoreductase [Aliikangiella marina]TQV71059.1 hybrid-cluster NAD(P)-dependent oxidoreductase [Aliikangiella marina]